jgi:hypothetical protein
MQHDLRCVFDDGQWLEALGEVELIGGWAEVTLAADFIANVDTSRYHVFATSYAAVPVFVSNRHATGFEIHAIPVARARLSRARCAWRAIGPRRPAPSAREEPW